MRLETAMLAEHEAPKKVLGLKSLRVVGSTGIIGCC
jgi:hypothetical protein